MVCNGYNLITRNVSNEGTRKRYRPQGETAKACWLLPRCLEALNFTCKLLEPRPYSSSQLKSAVLKC